ncbi:HAD hydrolase-like protein [Pseudomonas sp. MF6747]|uniref:HAD hydrolase-like protein n=1 Tax=Pseudomonas sp. MF6747 TaxID=2797527 RepID=UPI00190D5118|nr:HAD hydrolase-like protein [Pseudomonas sp. MF6747]MBK3505931.1 HAD hydrolase-like protein [Pseudomonas sp. MF6747]
MPVELILFDLDDTLLRTGDLEPYRGREFLNRQSPEYVQRLSAQFRMLPGRAIYSEQHLLALQQRFPGACLGVFTRSPRHYAETLLALAYPNTHWTTLVAHECVTRTKPSGEGVLLAMRVAGVAASQNVWLIGDGKSDIQAAYDAGCWCVLDQSTWPNPRRKDDWYALERFPDAIIHSADELMEVLVRPFDYLLVAERLQALNGQLDGERAHRFGKTGHFNALLKDGQATQIYSLGRHFSKDAQQRVIWHAVTNDIHHMKNVMAVPDYWIEAVRSFIRSIILKNIPLLACGIGTLVITVVPAKPGRVQRLEAMVAQIANSHAAVSMGIENIEFNPNLLMYLPGAQSHHGNGLNRVERFENVRDFLRASPASGVAGKHVVVIDDVVTSGASLIYSDIYLRAAGAASVTLLALTKNVGNG